MKLSHCLFAAVLLGGVAVAAAAVERSHQAIAPPSASELGLQGSQAARWGALRDQSIALRADVRQTLRRRIRQLDDLLADPDPDLDAFAHESDRTRQDLASRARTLRDQRLALYDSLTSAQRAHVRSVMRKRLARLQQLPLFDTAADAGTP